MPWRHQFSMMPRRLSRPAGCSRRMDPPRSRDRIASGWPRLAPGILEYFLGKAARIGRRLHHQRRHRADQGRLRHPAFAVPGQIVRHLAAAGGMADVNGVLQIEMRRQRRQVVGIVIHVVAVADLCGSAVAAAVMRDDAIALIEEEQHLRVPVIGRQRPAMAEHDGLTVSPVLVEDLHAIFGRNVHDAPPRQS